MIGRNRKPWQIISFRSAACAISIDRHANLSASLLAVGLFLQKQRVDIVRLRVARIFNRRKIALCGGFVNTFAEISAGRRFSRALIRRRVYCSGGEWIFFLLAWKRLPEAAIRNILLDRGIYFLEDVVWFSISYGNLETMVFNLLSVQIVSSAKYCPAVFIAWIEYATVIYVYRHRGIEIEKFVIDTPLFNNCFVNIQ